MRLAGVLGVLALVAAPVLAAPTYYTFTTTTGSVVLNIQGQGSTGGSLAGTFAVSFPGGHIGTGDTFNLEDSALTNTSTLKLGLAGLATATIKPSSARFLDFSPGAVGTVAGNLVPAIQPTDVYFEATVLVTGLTTTTFKTTTWAGTLLPFNVAFSTSDQSSAAITGRVSGTFGYEVGISDIGLTITLDLILNLEGTAHAVPDPALGGLTALGLGGAGAWLRRRHA
jgi:hypothetical protein